MESEADHFEDRATRAEAEPKRMREVVEAALAHHDDGCRDFLGGSDVDCAAALRSLDQSSSEGCVRWRAKCPHCDWVSADDRAYAEDAWRDLQSHTKQDHPQFMAAADFVAHVFDQSSEEKK